MRGKNFFATNVQLSLMQIYLFSNIFLNLMEHDKQKMGKNREKVDKKENKNEKIQVFKTLS